MLRRLSPLWLCLFVALLLRVWLIIHTHGMIDGDEALVGMQAEQILRGRFPVYFYGIPYFGSLEAYLASLFIAILGPSPWALRAEATALSLVLVWLTWRLASALADAARLPVYAKKCFTIVAGLVAAVPPLYDGIVELRTWGGYIETFVLMLLLLLSTLRLTQCWHHGASKRELLLRWVGIGFITGLGMWVYPLIALAIVAAAIWIAVDRVGEFRHTRGASSADEGNSAAALKYSLLPLSSMWAALLAGIGGFSPAIVWGATHHWTNIAYIQRLGGTWSLDRIQTTLKVTTMYLNCVAPRVIGGGLAVENTFLMVLHTPLLLFSIACFAITATLVVISLLWHHTIFAYAQGLAALPTLFATCAIIVYCTGAASAYSLISCSIDLAGRYATPLILAFPFFFATLFTLASMYFYQKFGSQLMRANDKLAISLKTGEQEGKGQDHQHPYWWLPQLMLCSLLLLYLGVQVWTYGLSDANTDFQSPYCSHAPANYGSIITYMQQQHIRYAWAPNLLAHPITFITNSQIIVVDPLEQMTPPLAINRIPAYSQAVSEANRASFLVYVQHSDAHPLILRLLDTDDVTYTVARFPSEPRIDVIVVTPLNRTVSPINWKYSKAFNCFTT